MHRKNILYILRVLSGKIHGGNIFSPGENLCLYSFIVSIFPGSYCNNNKLRFTMISFVFLAHGLISCVLFVPSV